MKFLPGWPVGLTGLFLRPVPGLLIKSGPKIRPEPEPGLNLIRSDQALPGQAPGLNRPAWPIPTPNYSIIIVLVLCDVFFS